MVKYALINSGSYCIGMSELTGRVEDDNMVEIEEWNDTYLYRKYDKSKAIWTDDYMPTPDEQRPVTLEDIKNDNLTVMMGQAEQYEEQIASRKDIVVLMGAIAELYELMTAQGGVK